MGVLYMRLYVKPAWAVTPACRLLRMHESLVIYNNMDRDDFDFAWMMFVLKDREPQLTLAQRMAQASLYAYRDIDPR